MSETSNFLNLVVKEEQVTIQNGQNKSNAIDLKGASLKTLFMPAAFDGTEISFEVSTDGVNFLPYYNIDNVLIKMNCAIDRAYGFAAIDFYSIRWLKLVSNATEGSDRVITLLTRGI